MPFPSNVTTTFKIGQGLHSGDALNNNANAMFSGLSGITAAAGGGKANATYLNGANCVIATVATAADSVLLPKAFPGAEVFVQNAGANSAQVFGQGTDTIQGAATGTGVALAAGAAALYRCVSVTAGTGAWFRFVSA